MSLPLDSRPEPRRSDVGSPIGLRVRLWLACLAGGLVAGLGAVWVLGTQLRPEAPDPGALLGWLSAVAALAVLVGAAFALWLDHHVIEHLRGLQRGMRTGRVAELRGLPAAAGWGELTELTDSVQLILTQQRHTSRAAEDLEDTRRQLEQVRSALERWLRREHWEAPGGLTGEVGAIADALHRGLSRIEALQEQNREAAGQVATEIAASLGEAQESAEQAERGFVEATALLTTVRELQRLGGELHASLSAQPAPRDEAAVAAAADAFDADEQFRAQARLAIEDLSVGSGESVESLARSMSRVQEISDQVQLLASRATLIAIQAVVASRRGSGEHVRRPDELADELKTLSHEVRAASDRTSQLALEIDAEVSRAVDRMRIVRERVGARLEQVPITSAPPAAVGARTSEEVMRLLERVREMVQDAAKKGERLSAAGERASRAAERLARRLDDEAREAEGLRVRMTPVGEGVTEVETSAIPPGGETPDTATEEPDVSAPPDLRLLGADDVMDGDSERETKEDRT